MRAVSLFIAGALTAGTAIPVLGQPRRQVGAPETFTANANVKGPAGVAAATIQIVIDRYTPDAERTAVEAALKQGGYPAFLIALRKAPVVGHVELGDQKFSIRWARQTDSNNGRTIVVVTDSPMFFVGGAAAKDAKPREGYEVALIRMVVDMSGLGSGTMAGAARVKPAPEGGVQVDDYAEEPVKLLTVTRKLT
ncbi:MAG TPA: hypothetical protein VLD67_10710 [Vicinamibacterales bacterium]|nr:hypothetical protein [Vicinamibacterales bacterium]